MIKGRFDQNIPKVECLVSLPKLITASRMAFASVEFTVSTGAAITRVSQADAEKMGFWAGYPEEADLIFQDDDGTMRYKLPELRLNTDAQGMPTPLLPSVLGRDIIDNWVMTFDWPNQIFECDPIYGDPGYDVQTTNPTEQEIKLSMLFASHRSQGTEQTMDKPFPGVTKTDRHWILDDNNQVVQATEKEIKSWHRTQDRHCRRDPIVREDYLELTRAGIGIRTSFTAGIWTDGKDLFRTSAIDHNIYQIDELERTYDTWEDAERGHAQTVENIKAQAAGLPTKPVETGTPVHSTKRSQTTG